MIPFSSYLEFLDSLHKYGNKRSSPLLSARLSARQELGRPPNNSAKEFKVEIFSPGHGPHTRRPESTKKEILTIAQMKNLINHCRASYGSKDNWACQRAASCLEEMIKYYES